MSAPKFTTKQAFGTFAGVFTPTTLTILGVIMYIRQPWVVGNAGVAGALAIVLLSVVITLTTALSLSSITTNVRIGSGGAFSRRQLPGTRHPRGRPAVGCAPAAAVRRVG